MWAFGQIRQWWQWFYNYEEPQFILWAPVCLGIGISYYFANTVLIPFKISIITLFILSGLSLYCRYYHYLYRNILYAFNLVCLGYCLILYMGNSLNTPFITHDYKTIFIKGTLDHIESRPNDWRLIIKDTSFLNQETPAIHKVRLVHKVKQTNMDEFVPGDRVKILASLNPPKLSAFPGAYDFRLQAYFSDLSASGFTHKKIEKISVAATTFWQRQRHILTNFFITNLSKPQGAIAAALVTGERGSIPSTLRNQYADAGIAHILAISGLHVSVVAGIVFFIFRRLLSLWFYISRYYDIKKLAAGMAICFTFCYMQLSGASYPAIRSFIMISLILGGIIIDRPAVTLRNVAVAALLILIIIPQALISASFQLSFSAVIGLVAVYEHLRTSRWALKLSMENKTIKRGLSYFFGLGLSSLIATIATTPYTIFTFHRFTLVALISNFAAIPLISFFIMPLLLIYLLLACFGKSSLIGEPLTLSLKAMNFIAEYTSTLPLAHIKVRMFSGISLGMMTIGLLWLLFWKSKIKWFGIFILSAALIKVYYFEPLPDLFINAQKTLICYYTDGQGFVNTRQKSRFDRTLWQDALALTEVEKSLPTSIENYALDFMRTMLIKSGTFIWISGGKSQAAYQTERPWNLNLCSEK